MIRQKNDTSEDILYNFINGLGRFLLIAGVLATLVSAGFLAFYFQKFMSMDSTLDTKQALNLVELFGKGALIGGMAAAIGASMMFWGEEVLGVLVLGAGAAFYFAPAYLPSMLGGEGGTTNPIPGLALQRLQTAGLGIGLVGLVVLGFDVTNRIQNRIKYGAKSDTLKYGKGVKEEDDMQLVFLGKCWQMSYCRKFVREKCPIYHAKRTCWRERVGCMCEEKVIANAMSGTISKDAIAATKYIPYNNQIPMAAKVERCRHCVIYNERQRQKYKIALPMTVLAIAGLYVVLREPLKAATAGVAMRADKFLGTASMAGGKTGALERVNNSGFIMMQEVLAAAVMIMALAYALKMTEFLIFKLKI